MGKAPVVYGQSERPPRGDYSRAADDYTCAQNYAAYTEADHDTYRRLYARQKALLPGLASQAFVDGALAGLGWGMNPLPLVTSQMQAGALVELVPGTPLDVPLHWQFARRTAPALAGLTRALQMAAVGTLLAPEKKKPPPKRGP